MLESGFITALRWRGVPIELHWTLFVGAVFVGGLRFAPGVWLGFFLLVLFHELGHALLVRSARARVLAIRMHGFGGECRYDGRVSPLARSAIAWGGVLAQGVLFGLTFALLATPWAPRHRLVTQMLSVWLEPNLVLIGLNLLPFRPLDGAEAWKLFGRLRDRRGRRREAPPRARAPASVEGRVRETVREALERAKREAREGRQQQR